MQKLKEREEEEAKAKDEDEDEKWRRWVLGYNYYKMGNPRRRVPQLS